MTKALFKKQMMESFSWLFFNRKKGKKRTKVGIAFFSLLYLGLFGLLGFMFFILARALCEPLTTIGLGWLYFSLISLLAVALGVFGSVFNTYASLYQAKDNDLLLSMPISPSKILLMRLLGVYLMGLLYECIVMIPGLVVWFLWGSVPFLGVVFSLLIPFVLSFFILTLSCILGWAVALVSSKLRHKSLVSVVLSLAFIGGYYYVYFQAYQILAGILANAGSIAKGIKNYLYPMYHMGLAAEGSAMSMFVFTGMIALLFATVCYVLSKTFIRLATSNKGSAKIVYRERLSKVGSGDSALLRKEFRRFTGSANYMLNCGLGILFMLIAAVALLIKGDLLMQFLPFFSEKTEEIMPLLLTAGLCMIASMSDITAPSVSLEGKTLWLVQVLPISPWQVLKAKMKLHLFLTIPPAAVLTVCACMVLKPEAHYIVIISITVLAFIVTMALLGLTMNLKAPNLKWTNEIVPIKQSFSVTAALLGGWGIVIIFGGLYFFISKLVGAYIFLILVSAVLILTSILLYGWLKKRGTKILAAL